MIGSDLLGWPTNITGFSRNKQLVAITVNRRKWNHKDHEENEISSTNLDLDLQTESGNLHLHLPES